MSDLQILLQISEDLSTRTQSPPPPVWGGLLASRCSSMGQWPV